MSQLQTKQQYWKLVREVCLSTDTPTHFTCCHKLQLVLVLQLLSTFNII